MAYQRAVKRSITPCLASAFAASRRVVSSPIWKPGSPRRGQTPAEPVVPPGVREPQAEMRRAGEATAEERDAVAELGLQPARARGGAVVVIGRGAGYMT